MFIKRDGTGSRTFVGLHGWSGTHRTFAPLIPHLPEGVTLYSLDLPGYGRSPAPEQWDLSVISEELKTAIIGIGISRFTLIGNCSGAIVGLFTALGLSERIERIVVIDPFAYMPWYFRVFLSGNWGRYIYASTFANPVGRWITNTALRGKRTAKTDLTDSFATIDHAVTFGYLKLFASAPGIDPFKALTMPIDIAYGENTFGAIKRSLPHWRRIWPHARLQEMKGAGHLPILEATEQVAKIIFQPVNVTEDMRRT